VAHLVQRDRLTDAWLAAMQLLLGCRDGKAVNLNVAFPAAQADDPAVTAKIDATLAAANHWQIATVANTIFPAALYHPHLGEEAAPRLYENYAMSMRMHRRRPRDKDTYFNRLVAYPIATPESPDPRFPLNADGTWNQLRFYIDRLTSQRLGTRRSSSYELGISSPADGDLRIQVPYDDKKIGSFPCLSHISLTLVDDHVHMNATYRNQTFVTRAYGNYIGLAALLRFIAAESGALPGEVQVVATHADADCSTLGAPVVRTLVGDIADLPDDAASPRPAHV
jgi:hypothetical protein